ncbi:MAG: hypothetical protein EPO68_12270 [Planctomycetota bacterium]|nr:MAG: hypothetical protein EPO68_12270 [Planctomycetota bacterium]
MRRRTPTLLLCLALACGCATAPTAPAAPPPVAHEAFGYDAAGVPWALRPTVDELAAAMKSRDDALAERLIERLRAQLPPDALSERLEAWSRVLEGRVLSRELELRLECRRVEVAAGKPERRALVLCIANPHAAPITLDCAPPRLVRTSTWIDERGELARNQDVSTLHAFERLEIPAALPSEVELAQFEPRTGPALAVRERFELAWTAGVLSRAGRAMPFDRETRCACDYVGLAGKLPTGAVEPAELVRYARTEVVLTPALVERAVRIAPARYDEALDALAAARVEFSSARLVELAPALRWLARDPGLGADAEGWQEWLRARHNRAAARDASPLDLP